MTKGHKLLKLKLKYKKYILLKMTNAHNKLRKK